MELFGACEMTMANLITLQRSARRIRSAGAGLPSVRCSSFWSHLKQAPLDGNHATAAAFEADPSPLKVNLGRGVYKCDDGKSWKLPCVEMAEQTLAEQRNGHDYLPFSGLKEFADTTGKFAFGADSPVVQEQRVATVQTISGTGALRVGAEFLSRFHNMTERTVLVSDPTYVNHFPVFGLNGFEVKQYRYYDNEQRTLDFEGMKEDIHNAPQGSVILFHACAHNPTGMDPTEQQWKELSQLCRDRKLLAFFDCAYQGFASGSPDLDAIAFRTFVQDGHQILLAQSYAKNFGLYGQRVGALNVVTTSPQETKLVMSNLNQVIRPMYSNPPGYGARLVATVFNEPKLREEWDRNVKQMADRLNGCRARLVSHLEQLGSKRDWRHISRQIGMFSYSGLSKEEVERLRAKHVYMNYDGRMSISGINSKNVEYLAEAIHSATSSS